MDFSDLVLRPWPWYIAGPVIGLMVPLLLVLGNRRFGVSGSLRNICAAVLPRGYRFFGDELRSEGGWKLPLVAGILLGGFIAGQLLGQPDVAISDGARAQLQNLGVSDFSGLAPREIFSWSTLLTFRTLCSVVVGGFLVGFGTAWAGGCTSGHGITGMATFERASLLALLGFFAGGLVATFLILPLVL